MLNITENPVRINSFTAKQELKILLESGDITGVVNKTKIHKYKKALMYLLYDDDKLIQWRVIEAIGRLAFIESQEDIEKVREMIRRQFWMMNDESGSLSWHGPEIVAEILCNVPDLLDEYGMILTSFMAEEPFERGSHWAVQRLVQLRPDIFIMIKDKLLHSLADNDPAIRGYSLMALTALRVSIPEVHLNILKNDDSNFEIFDFKSSEMTDISIRDIVNSNIIEKQIESNSDNLYTTR
ncbi:MAG: hypothetical protein GY855_15440 [candidate division Zixibacteria bacterium]|nr:hypothetical protein [candidate division Zixibacteria bacterium]